MKVSVIISVYKDVEALNCVLHGLSRQTYKDFEVFVTEDGEDSKMREYFQSHKKYSLKITHLTQEDIGFRKTRAVNRAIAKAKTEYLIFLDGDTVPHPRLVENHLNSAEPGKVCAGRRMHLGPLWSNRLRKDPLKLGNLVTWPALWLNFFSLHKDHVRNFEIGAPSAFLGMLFSGRKLNIVGCNFSCFKSDMLKVNGYDESLPGIGGEDCDLHWRFEAADIKIKNVKFLAVAYHLYHEVRRVDYDANRQISDKNKLANRYFAQQGICNHKLN